MKFRTLITLLIILFLTMLLGILYIWYLDVAVVDPLRPNIPQVISSYFTDSQKFFSLWNNLIYGQGLQGSSIYVRYHFLLYLIPIWFLVQYELKRRFDFNVEIFHTNWLMILLSIFATIVGMTVCGIAQAEDLYFMNIQYSKDFIVPFTYSCGNATLSSETPFHVGDIVRVAGSFSWVTHFTIMFIFALWLGQVNLIELIGKDNKYRKLYKNILIFLSLALLSVWWEIHEAYHTTRFGEAGTNLLGDSLGDISISLVSIFVALIVSYWIIYLPVHRVGKDCLKKLKRFEQ